MVHLQRGERNFERAAMDEVLAWQSRPLEPMYPVIFFDALRVKIRADGLVRNKAVYLALGVLPDGSRDILALWIENTKGAKFWMKVFNDLKTRGVHDILIAVTDGLQGMEQALGAVFPRTTLQTCIVHLIRSSLDYANWKDRKALASALKPVYTAPSAEAAAAELDVFDEGEWGRRYPLAPCQRLCLQRGKANGVSQFVSVGRALKTIAGGWQWPGVVGAIDGPLVTDERSPVSCRTSVDDPRTFDS